MHSALALLSPPLLSRKLLRRALLTVLLLASAAPALAQSPYKKNKFPYTAGDLKLRAYLEKEVAKIEQRGLAAPKTAAEWPTLKAELQRKLRDMLLLDPLPERTDLKATTTSKIEADRITVENVYFQSSPGLYVTGNLYLPAKIEGKAPAILYLCGHGAVKKDGVSYGNKVHYQHHGIWFARQGYVCLIIDSLQLGEIEGLHHGTHRLNQWWWACRGYSPAAVEAWNCVRALDYLVSRPEVDPERLGVTGRSGGGAYSWWIAAIDDRVKVAAPVAGITDLRDYVVEDCIEGHCDCMFMTNTYQWDYPQVAALVAPQPLLIVNTDSDDIFPFTGVSRTFFQVRELYQLLGKAGDFALSISPGGHVDSQEVQLAAFTWFNRLLKGDAGPITELSEKLFEPQQLKVFAELPVDQINTEIQKSFGPPSPTPVVPTSAAHWAEIASAKKAFLNEMVFRRLTASRGEKLETSVQQLAAENGLELLRVVAYDAEKTPVAERYILRKAGALPDQIRIQLVGDEDWLALKESAATPSAEKLLAAAAARFKSASLEQDVREGRVEYVLYSPPAAGEWTLNPDPVERNHLARRALLIGDTLASIQVHDLVRLLATLPERSVNAKMKITARGDLAGVALYASLYAEQPLELELGALPSSHMKGPILINVLRGLDVPESVALAAEKHTVRIHGVSEGDFAYPLAVQKKLGWKAQQLQITP